METGTSPSSAHEELCDLSSKSLAFSNDVSPAASHLPGLRHNLAVPDPSSWTSPPTSISLSPGSQGTPVHSCTPFLRQVPGLQMVHEAYWSATGLEASTAKRKLGFP